MGIELAAELQRNGSRISIVNKPIAYKLLVRFAVFIILHICPWVPWLHGCGSNAKNVANVTNEKAPKWTFKKIYLVAFLGHAHALMQLRQPKMYVDGVPYYNTAIAYLALPHSTVL